MNIEELYFTDVNRQLTLHYKVHDNLANVQPMNY